MSLDETNRRILVNNEIDKARSTFEQAEWMKKGEYWDGAAGRLYYALFHAVTALLINDGHIVKTHSGLNSRFGELYVKTGIFPKEFADTFTLLQNMREKSDYNCSFNATQDMVEPLIEPARRMIETIACHINQISSPALL